LNVGEAKNGKKLISLINNKNIFVIMILPSIIIAIEAVQ